MKRYDYKCESCDKVWEYLQDGWEEQYNCPRCPACKSTDIKRLIPMPSVSINYSPAHPRYRRGKGR